MLTPGHSGTSLVVCTTCRGGPQLAADLRAAGDGAVAIETVACLWSCDRSASVQLRHPGKIGYVMGDFADGAARDLLDFARAHAASTDGEVPFDRWPAGVLGHFIARVPPPGKLIA